MPWRDEFFSYKGYSCKIEHEYEEDNVKAWHFVVGEDGFDHFADITPYDSSPETLKLWIDAGMPPRVGRCPLHREDLEKIINERA
jgi:hypothetical protein